MRLGSFEVETRRFVRVLQGKMPHIGRKYRYTKIIFVQNKKKMVFGTIAKYSLALVLICIFCVMNTLVVLLYQAGAGAFDGGRPRGSHIAGFRFADPFGMHLINIGQYGIASVISPDEIEGDNPHPFLLPLNHPERCRHVANKSGSNDVFLLILVASAPRHYTRRMAIRKTWGQPQRLGQYHNRNVITLFLLGKPKNSSIQMALQQEDRIYRDIIEEDFMDSYKNLTLKTIMGLKWAYYYCQEAKYIMKTDDDMLVNTRTIVSYLEVAETTELMVGWMFKNPKVVRDPNSKWFVPLEQYPYALYPPYCVGTGYVMSADVAFNVYMTSLKTTFFWLEDVYVGMCLLKLGIKPRMHELFDMRNVPYDYCTYRTFMTVHEVSTTSLYKMWDDMSLNKNETCAAKGNRTKVTASSIGQ
ncbi:beta-1,3-galactosyltransferase 1-like [Saccoglossus kowalevskii]|uniref:Hexosyltransferase n=1 Tax=Saccoglossus kowalevskii TaxID=10224 RepID=A0ABM0GQ59_SACKO|nr:PREDICTED: beta-1,3-galactosyltransferase 1-like [Saccoglossus kowalevskii]